jgi:hypothetical protein
LPQTRASVVSFEARKIDSLAGTRLVSVPRHADERGFLIAFDRDQSLPFEVRRVYCIYPGAADPVRGEHATSAHCALVALQGSVAVDVDNGAERAGIRLSRCDQALCIHAGVWLRVLDFSSNALVLVAAWRLFAESVYYNGPNRELPEMRAAACPAQLPADLARYTSSRRSSRRRLRWAIRLRTGWCRFFSR